MLGLNFSKRVVFREHGADKADWVTITEYIQGI